MPRSTFAPLLVAIPLLFSAARASAHPVPFSYLDIRLEANEAEVTIVAHVFDIAHDLHVDHPETLLDERTLAARSDDLRTQLASRLQLAADGEPLQVATWTVPRPLPDRQAVRLQGRIVLPRPTGLLTIDALMFTYDAAHQTFVNVYEHGELTLQAVLDARHSRAEYFSGGRQGTLAVVRRFLPAGVHHILIGPDHLLFLVGLLLLGGSLSRLTLVASAFTLAHSLTLSLAALGLFQPPARVIEPAIALSIVYVGIDNLVVRDGRDVRAWIAFGFGFVHGFGFANVLREMDLPPRALGWSLFSFNAGVEVGQLLVVLLVASAIAILRSKSEVAGRRLAFAGSLVVVAAGAFWFIERVFLPGGIA
ncbi:MAG: HupE/UreJ family protein [Acidobacteriota bacterium]